MQEDHEYMNYSHATGQAVARGVPDLVPQKDAEELQANKKAPPPQLPQVQPAAPPPIVHQPVTQQPVAQHEKNRHSSAGADEQPTPFALLDNKPVPGASFYVTKRADYLFQCVVEGENKRGTFTDYPNEPTIKPNGEEKMPWPDVISQTLM